MIEATDANDVLDLAHWLAGTPDGFRAQVDDDHALESFRQLVTRAATLLNQTAPDEHADALVDRLRARRASDAAAQALCTAAEIGAPASGDTDELYHAWKAATDGA